MSSVSSSNDHAHSRRAPLPTATAEALSTLGADVARLDEIGASLAEAPTGAIPGRVSRCPTVAASS